MTDLQRKIIAGLRWGPLNYIDLAREIDQTAFLVRGELKHLQRDHYVTNRRTDVQILLELTSKGWQVATGPIAEVY